MSVDDVKAFTHLLSVPATNPGDTSVGFDQVQEFLERFGYLKPSEFAVGVLDDPTGDALERFQRFNGLEPTGVFDDQTREMMTRPRCGLPDPQGDSIEFATTCAWTDHDVSFAFETGTGDVPGTAEFDAVRRAIASWETLGGLTFTEVGVGDDPDVLIDWRPANDPDHSMVGGVLAHADFPPGCSVVTNNLPKPLHFDDSEHEWSVGAVAGAFDIETVALHEFGHIVGLAHSSVAGAVMAPTVSSNFTKRALTADDTDGYRRLYPDAAGPLPAPLRGELTIQQISNNRFVDAHEIAGQDFRLVTRPAQNNDTQRWRFTQAGEVYTWQQASNGRFVDAHENAGQDFRLVTRPSQDNASQQWVFRPVPGLANTFTIQQLSNGRFVDAHEIAGQDFRLVTRPAQNNPTQRWLRTPSGGNHTIQQVSNGRFVDAHEHPGEDFRLVTRPAQNNDTQRWSLTLIGRVYTIQQVSNGRFVDAHEHAGEDFRLVTRPAQNNDTQLWVLLHTGPDTYTIQQLSNGRYVDAHEHAGEDFRLVTRPAQNNTTQRWRLAAV